MISSKIIYNNEQDKFFKDVLLNKFADAMKENFVISFGRNPGEPEYNSWRDAGEKIKNLIELGDLKNIHVAFEYQIPYTQKRVDCLLFGKNKLEKGIIVHIELKQWQKVEALDCEGNFVETYTGGGLRKVVHPSQQVKGYHDYIKGFVEVLEEDKLDLIGCSYCPNYRKKEGEGLFNYNYKEILEKFPLYTNEDISELANRLKELLKCGEGFEIFNKFMQSPNSPSRKLLDTVSKVIKGESDFSLLDDQIRARNTILGKIKKAQEDCEKNVIIIKGGPGTGKTVIALHILAEIAGNKNKKYNTFFSSRSKPLIEAIKYKMQRGEKAKLLFTSLNPFIPSRVKENELDLLIVDEAHRIGEKSNHRFTKIADRTDMPQIEQLIRCAKTSVFFIDDKQIIRGAEVGSTELIRNAAKKYQRNIEEDELNSQFRCNGSDNYLDWLEYVLGHSSDKRILKKTDNFDFKIINSPEELSEIIKKKDNENGKSARMVAGYCWNWTNKLNENGELEKDVKIGNFEMPWETHGNIKPPEGYVMWYEWAYKPEGVKQVGCIYTAQGFEFDYIGVIVGPDLKYDKKNDCLVGNIEGTKDPMLKRDKKRFDDYVKNIYRVLMSRGMKGCYVYFVDKEVEKFFKSRLKM
jgi:hypothetical protein